MSPVLENGSELASLLIILTALALRVHPSLRRWAPRGVRPQSVPVPSTRSMNSPTRSRDSTGWRNRPARLIR